LKATIAARVSGGAVGDAYLAMFRKGRRVDRDGLVIPNDYITDTVWRSYQNRFLIPPDVDSLVIYLAVIGPGSTWFDDLSVEWNDDLKAPKPKLKKEVAKMLRFAKTSYWKRDSVDWKTVERAVWYMALGASNDSDFYPSVYALVSSIGDPHAYVHSGHQRREQRKLTTQEPQFQVTFPTVTLINGKYGLIEMPPFVKDHPALRKQYADTLLQQIRTMDQTVNLEGWIVDMRRNGGGFVDPMIAGLSPLIDTPIVYGYHDFSKKAKKRDVWFYLREDGKEEFFTYTPYKTKKPLPVAVLSGPGCASAGEGILIGFKQHNRAKIFGTHSAGLTTGPKPYLLPDGGLFTLSAACFFDRNGVYYWNGVPPDVYIPQPPPHATEEEDAVVKAALKWLQDNPEQ